MSRLTTKRPTRRGFSYIEMMTVVAIVGIFVAVSIPSLSPSAPDQLESVAQTVVADLDFARTLAMTNNSTYRITFNPTTASYVLTHVGANTALNVLPSPPPGSMAVTQNNGTEHKVTISSLPQVRMPVAIVSVRTISGTIAEVTTLEFGPLGETTRAEGTAIWVGAGTGQGRQYQEVEINPVTGLARVQSVVGQSPIANVDTSTGNGTTNPPVIPVGGSL